MPAKKNIKKPEKNIKKPEKNIKKPEKNIKKPEKIQEEPIPEEKILEEDDLDTDEEEVLEEFDIEEESNIHKIIKKVKRDDMITSHILQKTEYTEIISQRASQIEQGSQTYVDTTDLSNPIDKAIKELKARKCPMAIRRYVGNNMYEQISVNELDIEL